MKQTYLESGAYLAHPVRARRAGGFTLGTWTDDGSETKGPHGHADAHFMLITSGCYETAASDEPGGNLLIYNPPGTWHDDRFHGGGAFFTITVPDGAPAGPIRLIDGHMTMRRALREVAEWTGDSAPIAEALCWELVGAANGAAPARSRPKWLTEACDYLRDNASASVDLRDVSRAMGVHPVHLTRTFRAFLRCTPGEYLRAWRLDRAASSLTEGLRSLAQIAFDNGFTDQSHLSRHFRRAYGVSPGEYRRLTRRN
ncbi:MAG TPA: AraC family transcriptional regulator [Rhizomicrobium sp.]|jgi:AraC family transcriptional regulator